MTESQTFTIYIQYIYNNIIAKVRELLTSLLDNYQNSYKTVCQPANRLINQLLLSCWGHNNTAKTQTVKETQIFKHRTGQQQADGLAKLSTPLQVEVKVKVSTSKCAMRGSSKFNFDPGSPSG